MKVFIKSLKLFLVVIATVSFTNISGAQEIVGEGEKNKACVNDVIDENTATVQCKGEGEMCEKINNCLKVKKEDSIL